MEENLETYVCITHHSLVPCEQGENHLISNWNTDVNKILKLMREKENGS
jgi:hypothetical protein